MERTLENNISVWVNFGPDKIMAVIFDPGQRYSTAARVSPGQNMVASHMAVAFGPGQNMAARFGPG